MAISNDGAHLLVGDNEGRVRLWDLALEAELEMVPIIRPVRTLEFSPCGKRAAAVAEEMKRNTIHVWDLADGTLNKIHAFPNFNGRARLAFSHDGRLLADGGAGDIIRVRDLRNGKEVAWLVGQHAIRDVAFSPDATHLIAPSHSGQCCLWELPETLFEPANQGD